MHLRLHFGLVIILISFNSAIFSYNPEHLAAVKSYSNRIKAAKKAGNRTDIVGNFKEFDLSNAELSSLDLEGAVFTGANFSGAKLYSCNFTKCRARNANFNRTDLSSSNFANSDLKGSSFVRAKSFSSIIPLRSSMGGWNVVFVGANLHQADLTQAFFSYSDFRNSNLTDVKLGNADFSYSDLAGSSFDNSSLQGVNLYKASMGNVSVVGCDVQQTALTAQSVKGNPVFNNEEMIRSLAKIKHVIRHGQINKVRIDGKSLLHLAIGIENASLVRYLLAHNADINTTDDEGETPFSLASRLGHMTIVQELLGRGTDVNRLANGRTSLHVAAQSGRPAVLRLLLQTGADKYKRDNQGRLPICDAGENQVVAESLRDKVITNKNIKFKDIIGADDILLKLRNIIRLYNRRKLVPSFLLFEGDSGTGKTFLAHAFANETGFAFFEKSAASFKNMWHGGSEDNVKKEFDLARDGAPSVLFIDEIDALAGVNRQEPGGSNVDSSTLDILLTSINEIKDFNAGNIVKPVILIGATNLVNNLDKAFRQRSDETIQFRNPSEDNRKLIIEHYLKKIEQLTVEDDFALRLAQETKGFSTRQLKKIIDTAERYASECDSDSVTTEHFISIFSNIYREVHPNIPQQLLRPLFSIPVSKEEAFRDLTGMDDVIESMDTILDFFRNPEEYIRRDVEVPKAYLLEGPPGAGKTSIATALAQAGGLTFFNHTGAQLLNGGSALVRKSFSDAREAAPSIIFIDEIDSLGLRRADAQDTFSRSTLTEFLSQMEGFQSDSAPVIVIGTTNFASVLDDALQTRFKERIQVPLPNQEARKKILLLYLSKKALAAAGLLKDDFLMTLADETENFSGRELKSLVEKASLFSAKERASEINEQHIRRAAQIMTQQLALRQQQGQSSGTIGLIVANKE